MRITERLRMSCKLADGLAIFSERRFCELCDEIDAVNANLERENEELSRSFSDYESDAIEVMSDDLASATQEPRQPEGHVEPVSPCTHGHIRISAC